MATPNMAPDATANLILSQLMGTGKNTQTQTTSSNISGDSLNAMLQKILESTQGLAQVSSGQKAAGMYNSTVNTQMVNDLMTRASGEVLSQNRSQTTTTKNKQGSPLQSILTLGALQYGKKGVGKLLDLSGLSGTGSQAFDFVTGASSVSPTATFQAGFSSDPIGALAASQGWTTAEPAASAVADSVSASALADLPTATIAADGTGAIIGGGEVSAAGYDALTSGAAGDSAALWEGADAMAGATEVGGAAETAGAAAGAGEGTTVAGSTLGSMAGTAALYAGTALNAKRQYDKYDERDDTGGQTGTAIGTAVGAYFGGPIGALVGSEFGGPVGSFVSSALHDVGQPVLDAVSDIGSKIGDIFGW